MKFEHRDKYIKLGLKISYYRKLKGYTQEQLAEGVGLSTAFIGMIEAPNISKAISMDALFDISDFLEIPPKRFLDFEED